MWTRYSANNSGGGWWLEDKDWMALQQAGWLVEWVRNAPFHDGADNFLGAKAMYAYYPGSERMAMASFQDVTGEYPGEEGCPCCGPPHSFYEADPPDYLLNTVDGEVLPERKEIES